MHTILFVSHEASLTGAPRVVLRLARYLQDNFDVALVYLERGELLHTEPHNLPVFFFIPNPVNLYFRIHKRLFNKKLKPKYKAIRQIANFNPDVLCLNSIASLPFLFKGNLEFKNKIIYVHEMPIAIIRYFKLMGYKMDLFNKLDFKIIFVVNEMTKDFLIEVARVQPSRIIILLPSIANSFYKLSKDEEKNDKCYDLIFSGPGGWTKGSDLIPQLAYYLEKNNNGDKINAAWIGLVDETVREQINYELKLAEIEHFHIDFLGSRTDIKSILQSGKIFISLSRADAMPTACIEAMALGKPVICFNHSGGLAPLLNEECGYAVEYPDFEKMALCIQQVLSDGKLYRKFSEKAKIIAGEFCESNIGQQFIHSIAKVLTT